MTSCCIRFLMCRRNAVGDLLSAPGDDWIKQGESHSKNGDFTIYYKVEDGARLTCRIESPIPTSHLVPLLSVLNESELYEEWIPTFHRPFKMGVTSSKQLATFSRGHQVIQGMCRAEQQWHHSQVDLRSNPASRLTLSLLPYPQCNVPFHTPCTRARHCLM